MRLAKIRRWEFELIADELRSLIPDDNAGKLKILEFGCGMGSSAPYLSEFGDLVLSDIYRDSNLVIPPDVKFKLSDIHDTDFSNDEFDVLVSNQVLEYLDLVRAFREMKRIGKENALFAFSVPTTTWLLLSVPGEILKKFDNVFNRVARALGKQQLKTGDGPNDSSAEPDGKEVKSWSSRFGLTGHGRHPEFSRCFRSWKIKSWAKSLADSGFVIVSQGPLLCYGSSRLAIVPTSRFLAKVGLPASYLFVCKTQ